MSYTKTTWQDLPATATPITAAQLNRVESLLSALAHKAFNIVDYGAVCDDSTNDTAAVSAALAAAGAAGGGVVVVPGRSAVDPDVLDLPANVTLLGTNKRGSWLRLRAGGVLLDHSGTATGFANHVNHGALYNLSLNGNGFTGTLLRTYYADNFTCRGARFENIDGRAVDGVELWDSDFSQTVFETVSSATVAAVDLRNASAASGFGSGTDNTNMTKFSQCRWEGFKFGALRFWRGGFGTQDPNGLFIDSCKFETHTVRGMPVYIDDTSHMVNLHKVEGFMGAFDAGYSTAHPFITCNAPGLSSLRDIRGVTGAASMASVVQSFCGAGPATIDNIEHRGTNDPTVAVVDFQGGPGRYAIGNVYSATGGTLFAGTHPANRSTTFATPLTATVAGARTTHRITLTGNITINVPAATGRQIGDRLRFELTQDATGGRTTTWGAGFRANWTPTTTANARNVIEFEYNGTDWMQAATAINI